MLRSALYIAVVFSACAAPRIVEMEAAAGGDAYGCAVRTLETLGYTIYRTNSQAQAFTAERRTGDAATTVEREVIDVELRDGGTLRITAFSRTSTATADGQRTTLPDRPAPTTVTHANTLLERCASPGGQE